MSREKVHVRVGRNVEGGHYVEVDGVDMSHRILADGFGVMFADDPALPDLVYMTVAADVLEVDLPDAVFAAMRGQS